MPLTEVQTIRMVFAFIPIVIIPVVTVIEPVAVIVVSTVFFLTPLPLRLGPGFHYRRRCQRCSKHKKTEQISIAKLHVVFLRLKIPCSQSLACKEYVVFALEAMFDSAHCL